uniref:Uncharacterized protein n=1 Tax=Sphaerodactylus townsendi TaxID=933632 RepID=A0ACB8FXW4_9SAUR
MQSIVALDTGLLCGLTVGWPGPNLLLRNQRDTHVCGGRRKRNRLTSAEERGRPSVQVGAVCRDKRAAPQLAPRRWMGSASARKMGIGGYCDSAEVVVGK